MKIQKMSLANVQGKLSRKEMKTIMAGSGSPFGDTCFGAPCYSDIQCQVCFNSYNRPYCKSGSCTVY